MRVVVLDVGLPDVDGFEVCRRVRARSRVPILMLTARDEEPDRIAGLEVGADDYVTKPFSPRELVRPRQGGAAAGGGLDGCDAARRSATSSSSPTPHGRRRRRARSS